MNCFCVGIFHESEARMKYTNTQSMNLISRQDYITNWCLFVCRTRSYYDIFFIRLASPSLLEFLWIYSRLALCYNGLSIKHVITLLFICYYDINV